MARVVITGTAGLLGGFVAKHFVEQGYDVLSVDKNPLKKEFDDIAPHLMVDLADMGQCYGMLKGADAVVHLAAVPRPHIVPNEVTFGNNVLATYNILEAADNLGIRKAVVASSECVYGFCFSETGLEPVYLPLDEDHPVLPEDPYGLGKICGEEIACAINRRHGMQIVSFRLGNIIAPEMYSIFHGFINDPKQRVDNLWNYVDARDIATACCFAVEKDGLGAMVLNIAADDNCTEIKSIDLVRDAFPNLTDIRSDIGQYQSLYDNKRAKKVLGWRPVHFWREELRRLQEN